MSQVIVGARYADKYNGLVWKVVGADSLSGTVRAQNGGHIRDFPWHRFLTEFTLLESNG